MLEILGKKYYIDINEIIEKCRVIEGSKKTKPKINEKGDTTLELNIFKFECFKACIERLLNEYEELDETMGVFGGKTTSVSFKIAYNTLLKYNILIEDDSE